MIHYNLLCDQAHEFDAWFAGSEAFDRLAASGNVQCPYCASISVTRALMAPAVRRSTPLPVAAGVPPPVAPAMPAVLRASLQKLRADVEASCDYVGTEFSTIVRAMREGEMPTRLVYGEATDEEARSLREDGLPVTRIPWLPKADA